MISPSRHKKKNPAPPFSTLQRAVMGAKTTLHIRPSGSPWPLRNGKKHIYNENCAGTPTAQITPLHNIKIQP